MLSLHPKVKKELKMEKRNEGLQHIAGILAATSNKTAQAFSPDSILGLLEKSLGALSTEEADVLVTLTELALSQHLRPDVTEVRPKVLECDVVRFQNNKDKWVALVGLARRISLRNIHWSSGR